MYYEFDDDKKNKVFKKITKKSDKRKSDKKSKLSDRDQRLSNIITIISVILLLISAIIVITTLAGRKKHTEPIDEVSENEIVEATEEDESLGDIEEVSENEIIEEAKGPKYQDLTLEEAWEIASKNNITMKVSSGTVNVRQRPTTASDKVGTAKANSVVYIIEEVEMDDGYTWCYVIYDKAASESGKDNSGNTMITIENKHYLGYIRKDLLE